MRITIFEHNDYYMDFNPYKIEKSSLGICIEGILDVFLPIDINGFFRNLSWGVKILYSPEKDDVSVDLYPTEETAFWEEDAIRPRAQAEKFIKKEFRNTFHAIAKYLIQYHEWYLKLIGWTFIGGNRNLSMSEIDGNMLHEHDLFFQFINGADWKNSAFFNAAYYQIFEAEIKE